MKQTGPRVKLMEEQAALKVSHMKSCVKFQLCYENYVRKINIQNPMGMKQL